MALRIDVLQKLHGRWVGRGNGTYPTIAPFEYDEDTSCEFAGSYPMLRWEQKTVLRSDGKPSHWELGFLRPLDDGSLELSTAQDSGRVEVLRGIATALQGGFRLNLVSTYLGNDMRLKRTERIVTVQDHDMHYEKYMETTTTPRPVWERHLEAHLRRC